LPITYHSAHYTPISIETLENKNKFITGIRNKRATRCAAFSSSYYRYQYNNASIQPHLLRQRHFHCNQFQCNEGGEGERPELLRKYPTITHADAHLSPLWQCHITWQLNLDPCFLLLLFSLFGVSELTRCNEKYRLSGVNSSLGWLFVLVTQNGYHWVIKKFSSFGKSHAHSYTQWAHLFQPVR